MNTYQNDPSQTGAGLVIFDGRGIHTHALELCPQWMVGRNTGAASQQPEILLDSAIVSRNHGAFRKVGSQWYYVDNPRNTNGTIYNGVKIPRPDPSAATLQQTQLMDGDVLRIDSDAGDFDDPNAVLMVFCASIQNTTWSMADLDSRPALQIGRNPDCDIVLPLSYISGHHAMVQKNGNQIWLTDNGSTAGTYLNRQRIQSPVLLRDKDCFSLCDRKFILSHGKLYFTDAQAARKSAPAPEPAPSGEAPAPSRVRDDLPVALQADILTKQVKNNSGGGMKELIRDIHLTIHEGTLVAMLGTAGAGKSTVMNCLNGMDLAGVQGSVVYRNVDLIEHFGQMKELIGSVPQQKIFHPTFTPEQEFRLAAKKRLPADTTDAEIEKRVDDTLNMLSIQGVRTNRNSKLSGGEQTRVNIGIELVADRELLCLDEPDQGLSPNYKHELFEILRNLAHERGKCVLCIIHDVSEIDMFDQVIMLVKKDQVGRLAFSGSPAEAREFFGAEIRDAYALLDKNPERFVK